MPRGVSVSATTWGTRWSFTDGNLCCRLLSRRSGRRRITIFNSAAESFFDSEEENKRAVSEASISDADEVGVEKLEGALQNPLSSSRIQVVPLPRINQGLAGHVCFSQDPLEPICLLNGNNRVEFPMLNEHRRSEERRVGKECR